MAQLVRDWEGETVFILAGGPSVLGLDLSLLKGRRVIAINSAHLSYPDADALFYADADWWTRHRMERAGLSPARSSPQRAWRPEAVKRLVKVDAGGHFASPGRIALSATSVSGAINIATLRGAGRVVLLGVDGCSVRAGVASPRWPLSRTRSEKAASIATAGIGRPGAVDRGARCRSDQLFPGQSCRVLAENALPRGDFAMLQRVSPKPHISCSACTAWATMLHQRAVLREMMKTHSVELQTYYTSMYHDLSPKGSRSRWYRGSSIPGSATGAIRRNPQGCRQPRQGEAGRTTGRSATITPRRKGTARCWPPCSARSG
jgi:hypothetical protein